MTEGSIFYHFPLPSDDSKQHEKTTFPAVFVETIGGEHGDLHIWQDEYDYQNKIIFHHFQKPHVVTAHEFDGRFSGNSLIEPVKGGKSARFRKGWRIFEISHT